MHEAVARVVPAAVILSGLLSQTLDLEILLLFINNGGVGRVCPSPIVCRARRWTLAGLMACMLSAGFDLCTQDVYLQHWVKRRRASAAARIWVRSCQITEAASSQSIQGTAARSCTSAEREIGRFNFVSTTFQPLW